jgi:ubiquinone/menaquinone biosynthesis C-methylase UbiE
MFSRSADLYDALYATFKDYRTEVEQLRELIGPDARTLLDVACGTGKHLELLREHYDVVGLDLDPALLTIARERLPGVELIEGDMTAFDLGRRFDAVVCLFSSIGYARTVGRLDAALASMARHVAPGGTLIVEPWLAPEDWRAGHVHMLAVDDEALKIARVTHASREGDVSIADFAYVVATPAGVDHFAERHELGLFTDAQYRAAFTSAGLRVEHDPEGLMGRGLYVARSA